MRKVLPTPAAMPRKTLCRPAMSRTLARLRVERRLERHRAQRPGRVWGEDRAAAVLDQQRRRGGGAQGGTGYRAQGRGEPEQIARGREHLLALDRDVCA